MELDKAIQYFEKLINAAISSGAYKTIEQVEEAKQALETIKSHLKK
jgi:hypothetical protein